MFYLIRDDNGLYLKDFGNPDRAQFSDRWRDRYHFYTQAEALCVADGLRSRHGLLIPIEADDCWLLSRLAWQFTQTYQAFFPVHGAVSSRFYQRLHMFEWAASTQGRSDRIYLNLEDFSVCCCPLASVQLYISRLNGVIKPQWAGLDTTFIDPKIRTKLEHFALDFWAILQPYKPALSRLDERARSR